MTLWACRGRPPWYGFSTAEYVVIFMVPFRLLDGGPSNRVSAATQYMRTGRYRV